MRVNMTMGFDTLVLLMDYTKYTIQLCFIDALCYIIFESKIHVSALIAFSSGLTSKIDWKKYFHIEVSKLFWANMLWHEKRKIENTEP